MKFEVQGEPGNCTVKGSWGALQVDGDEIFGLQQLWLPNVSLSIESARDLAEHLRIAADNAVEGKPRS